MYMNTRARIVVWSRGRVVALITHPKTTFNNKRIANKTTTNELQTKQQQTNCKQNNNKRIANKTTTNELQTKQKQTNCKQKKKKKVQMKGLRRGEHFPK
ncbi:hypothetical protein POVWA1_005020 [Plasmodium ovale wallikeri]|uniref:Uncharacterized protein n=1 Tax=Plasmodium ovale wallikeri TaxID=864142 RepID=A0A1A8YHJ3_PLAOA|nr:hypothetical protein POVWA1_005020 [Plasmodium ovale wallikeri]